MTNHNHGGHRKRLDEKARMLGLEFLTEHEQLEKILFNVIPRGNTNETAHDLLEKFGTIANILCAENDELQTVNGVGYRVAEYLNSLPAILGVVERSLCKERPKLDTTEKIGEYVLTLFYGRLVETAFMISLDTSSNLIRYDKVSDGTVDETFIYIRKVVETAIKNRASSVVISHNHPSGSLTPSASDNIMTVNINKALKAVDVKLKDHIIVARGKYFSFKEQGLIYNF